VLRFNDEDYINVIQWMNRSIPSVAATQIAGRYALCHLAGIQQFPKVPLTSRGAEFLGGSRLNFSNQIPKLNIAIGHLTCTHASSQHREHGKALR
jgi:hypothetical protein